MVFKAIFFEASTEVDGPGAKAGTKILPGTLASIATNDEI